MVDEFKWVIDSVEENICKIENNYLMIIICFESFMIYYYRKRESNIL